MSWLTKLRTSTLVSLVLHGQDVLVTCKTITFVMLTETKSFAALDLKTYKACLLLLWWEKLHSILWGRLMLFFVINSLYQQQQTDAGGNKGRPKSNNYSYCAVTQVSPYGPSCAVTFLRRCSSAGQHNDAQVRTWLYRRSISWGIFHTRCWDQRAPWSFSTCLTRSER